MVFCYFFNKLTETPIIRTYDLKIPKLEDYLAINLPSLEYSPSLWEIQQISGLSLEQAIKIKDILKSSPSNKLDFILKIEKIRGIGKKKSRKIAKIFFF